MLDILNLHVYGTGRLQGGCGEGFELPGGAGRVYGLVGESGSGKSTVLRAICGSPRSRAGRTCGRPPGADPAGQGFLPDRPDGVPGPLCVAAPLPHGRRDRLRTACHPWGAECKARILQACGVGLALSPELCYLHQLRQASASARYRTRCHPAAQGAASRRAHFGTRRIGPGRDSEPARPFRARLGLTTILVSHDSPSWRICAIACSDAQRRGRGRDGHGEPESRRGRERLYAGTSLCEPGIRPLRRTPSRLSPARSVRKAPTTPAMASTPILIFDGHNDVPVSCAPLT